MTRRTTALSAGEQRIFSCGETALNNILFIFINKIPKNKAGRNSSRLSDRESG